LAYISSAEHNGVSSTTLRAIRP